MTMNPWDVRNPSKYEKDADVLYLSVGRALSEWESLEGFLAHYFRFFCGGPQRGLAATLAYGSVVSFKGRAEMLRAAATGYFHEWIDHSMKDRFFDLLKVANNFSPRRNEIAHGCALVAHFEGDIKGQSLEASLAARRWLLLPNSYSTTKNKLIPLEPDLVRRTLPAYAYSTAEIDHYAHHFQKLRRDAWQLVMDWSDAYPDADILPPI